MESPTGRAARLHSGLTKGVAELVRVPWGHDRTMWERHDWVLDLVSDDELRRRRATIRARESNEALLAANHERNEVYRHAGGEWSPADPALATKMERAQAAHQKAFAETFYAPIEDYLRASSHGPSEARAMSEPFAILFLEWERAYPDEWAREAGRSGNRYGWKEHILKQTHRQGVGDPHREVTQRLVLETVRGPYRAKDWRYARIARQIDNAGLREALCSIAAEGDEGATLRAEYVLARLEQPGLSINRRSYCNWLAQRAMP